MPRTTARGGDWTSRALFALGGVGLVYLIGPLLLIVPLSLGGSPFLEFPPRTLSLRWYEAYFTSEAWLGSTMLSVQVAVLASVIATVLGTAAAIGTPRVPLPWRRVLPPLFMSPLLLPTIVLAVSAYRLYATLQLVGTPAGLVVAHAILGIPYVYLNVVAALRGVPRAYEEAALSLGARPLVVLRRVTLPLVRRGMAAGAVFAFVASFDEVVMVTFLGGTQAVTLPKRIFDGLFFELKPTVAAVSALLLVANIAFACLGLWLARDRPSPAPSSARSAARLTAT